MTIFESWKQSLHAFAPERLMPFLNRVVATAIMAYSLWVTQGWMLLVATAATSCVFPFVNTMLPNIVVTSVLWFLQVVVVGMAILLLFIILKQLLDGQQGNTIHNIGYYYNHIALITFAYVAVFAFFSLLLMQQLFGTALMHKVGVHEAMVTESTITLSTYMMLALYSSMGSILWIFFFFDGPATLHGMWKAAQNTFWLIVLNVPLMVAAYIALVLLQMLVNWLLSIITFMLFFIAPALVFVVLALLVLPMAGALYGHLWALSRK